MRERFGTNLKKGLSKKKATFYWTSTDPVFWHPPGFGLLHPAASPMPAPALADSPGAAAVGPDIAAHHSPPDAAPAPWATHCSAVREYLQETPAPSYAVPVPVRWSAAVAPEAIQVAPEPIQETAAPSSMSVTYLCRPLLADDTPAPSVAGGLSTRPPAVRSAPAVEPARPAIVDLHVLQGSWRCNGIHQGIIRYSSMRWQHALSSAVSPIAIVANRVVMSVEDTQHIGEYAEGPPASIHWGDGDWWVKTENGPQMVATAYDFV